MALTIDPHVDDPAPTVWQVCAAQPHGSAEDPAWTRLVFLDSGTVERDELEGTHTQRHVRPIRASMLPACVRIVCGAQEDSKALRDEPVHLSDLGEGRQQILAYSTSSSTSSA